MPAATSPAESRVLPGGLRLRRRKSPPIWIGVAGVAAAGLLLGTILSGAPPVAVLGTVAVLVAAGAAIYWPALGLAVLVFAYPFDLTTEAGPVKVTSSYALMGVLVLVLVGRQFLRNPPPIVRTKLDIPVLIFAAATVLTLAGLNDNRTGQLVAMVKAFGGFTIFFIATQSVRKLTDALLVVGAVIATGLVQAVQTILPFMTGGQAVSVDARATGGLADANLFGGYLVLIIPLVVALGVSFRKQWTIVPTIAATLVLAAALAVTLSRSGWLGLVAGAITLLVLLRDRRWRIAGIAAALAACFLAVGLSGPIAARLGPAPDTGPTQMLADRIDVWSAGFRIAKDHPIVGVGLDNFQDFYPSYSGRDDGLNHAHNLFLNIAAERGRHRIACLPGRGWIPRQVAGRCL